MNKASGKPRKGKPTILIVNEEKRVEEILADFTKFQITWREWMRFVSGEIGGAEREIFSKVEKAQLRIKEGLKAMNLNRDSFMEKLKSLGMHQRVEVRKIG